MIEEEDPSQLSKDQLKRELESDPLNQAITKYIGIAECTQALLVAAGLEDSEKRTYAVRRVITAIFQFLPNNVAYLEMCGEIVNRQTKEEGEYWSSEELFTYHESIKEELESVLPGL